MLLVAGAQADSAIARRSRHVLIDIADMETHGLTAGDIVQFCVRGNEGSVAFGMAWPSVLGVRGQAQLSEAALVGCQAKHGDVLLVDRVLEPLPVAQRVAVAGTVAKAAAAQTLETLADIGCVWVGQTVDVVAGGARRRLRITHVLLTSGAALIPGKCARASDGMQVTGDVLPAGDVQTGTHPNALKAIGGLQREVTEVRRLVDAALRAPDVFSEYGLTPPRGVLLAGPPGTGKTLLARSVAAASGASVHVINGAEVVGKHSGDAEARLRDVFAAARRQQPSVVLIDEIDALCPRRQGAGGAASRVVATLLTLLDGADTGDGVVVIGATNRPDALDAALRRPGRFDREITIGVPDELGRRAILASRLAATPHALSADQLDALAAATHGFVGADVAALVREAAVAAVRRHAAGAGLLEVTWSDMDVARRAVRPSALREVALDVPHVRWADIGGQTATKQQLREAVEWPLRHPDAFARMGVRPPKGVLLYGPPGCSKTLTARALASEAGLNFLAVRGPELFSKWVGESEKAVRAVFRRARAAAPAIVFFDEFDALAVRRGAADGTSVADRVLSQLLAELDGIEPLVRVIVVAATNRPDVIDPAVLRPGRIDRLIYVAPPDLSAREHIFRLRLAAVPAAPDVCASHLALRCEGFSGAEVVALCQDAAICAMTEDPTASRVEMRHFDACIDSHKCRITPEMLRFYADFHAAA